MDWWASFWEWAQSPLGATVVGGLILALILWILSRIPRVRKPLFGGFRRAFRFLGSLRLTTSDRIEKVYERGVDDGWAGHEREVAEEATISPSRPRPEPRWKVTWNGFGDENGQPYVIRNLVDRSAAYEVRLEADESRFEFLDGAHWADLSGVSSGEFVGRMKYWIQPNGVQLRVSWLDEQNVEHSTGVRLAPERKLNDGELDPEAPF